MAFELLGKTAICSAYYKKVNDGVHIVCYDKDGRFCAESGNPTEKACAYTRTGEEKELFFEGDGIEKRRMELVNKPFVGVCVGDTFVRIVEYLYTDITYDYTGNERKIIGKTIHEVDECYVVFYGNNKKRYVPKDCCKFVEKKE